MIKITKGLDLPIDGKPLQEIDQGLKISQVAVVTEELHGMKPTMLVKEGSVVKRGQTLFSDKKNPGVLYTSPAAGKVAQVNRGAKRVLQSVVVDVDGDDSESFEKYSRPEVSSLDSAQVRRNLIASGLWTGLRTRPFSRVPGVESTAQALFVTATETAPLSPFPNFIIEQEAEAFEDGLTVLSKLGQQKNYLCVNPEFCDQKINVPSAYQVERFGGVHPAGLAGTHIHFLDPVNDQKTVWSIGYQEVIAIGKLFRTGQLDSNRVVALAGPMVKKPRLFRVPMGAKISQICSGNVCEGEEVRCISGTVFTGFEAKGALDYLGRYHQQVAVLKEGRSRDFLSFFMPGFNKFSVKKPFFSKLLPGGCDFSFTTSREGSYRAMVPIECFETVMPLDIEPTFLLRSLLTQDTEQGPLLGALELDEEDLGLCNFVCPGKSEYGPMLRTMLSTIEKDG